jgi:hypothetical protein
MLHTTKDTTEKPTVKNGDRKVREIWVNFYPDHRRGHAYPTKEQADRASGFDREACIKFVADYVVGEGL